MTREQPRAGRGSSNRASAAIAVATLLVSLAGCMHTRARSTGEMIALARSDCVSDQPNPAFDSRSAACGYYQSHFVRSAIGKPADLLAYITATRTHCELDARQCPEYWNSVSDDAVLEQSYPGVDVQDPRIWAAKRAVVKACTDDSRPISPDGADAKPAACRQASLLLRGDGLAPRLLRQTEHKACDLGEVDECHDATLDGETVDIKASQAVAAARARSLSGNLEAPQP